MHYTTRVCIVTKLSKSPFTNMDTAEQRRQRCLQRRKERYKECRDRETSDEREKRLSRRRQRDAARSVL